MIFAHKYYRDGLNFLPDLVVVREDSDHRPGIVLTLTMPGRRAQASMSLQDSLFIFTQVFFCHMQKPLIVIT